MTAIPNTSENADKLATAFVATLREWLTPVEFAAVRIANAGFRRRGDLNICASHDVCDANMAMLEAFRTEFGRAPFMADDVASGACNDSDLEAEVALWSTAWGLADRDLVAPLWQVEFPDFPVSDLPEIPEGWIDQSWRNDACPFWLAPPKTGIFVDYGDTAMRDFASGPRFVVVRLEADGTHPVTPDEHPLLATDDWGSVLTFVLARKE